MQYFHKIFILLLILAFYDPLQGKQGLEDHTSYIVSHVQEEIKSPFLRHTEGCRSIGIFLDRMPDNQVFYGAYYHMYLSPSIALRFSGGISPVRCNDKRHIRWVIAPSFLYTFFSAYAHHYIGLSLGPIIEYGPYQAAIFRLSNRNDWDIRVTLVPHYTYYFHKHWAFCIGIGPCIGFFKYKGKSGLLGNVCLQYNL